MVKLCGKEKKREIVGSFNGIPKTCRLEMAFFHSSEIIAVCLNQRFLQPRSQGSLLPVPTERERERVGKNPGNDVVFSRDSWHVEHAGIHSLYLVSVFAPKMKSNKDSNKLQT